MVSRPNGMIKVAAITIVAMGASASAQTLHRCALISHLGDDAVLTCELL